MGLEELIHRLQRDADARIAAIDAQADAEVRELSTAVARASSRAREAELATRRAARRAELDREIATARRRGRTEVLRAEHALVERVVARALELAADADRDPAYAARCVRDLEDALRYVEGRPAVVRCRPALAGALATAIVRAADVTIEPAPETPAGFVLAARDGSFVIDGTLSARLARARPRVAIEIMAEVRR